MTEDAEMSFGMEQIKMNITAEEWASTNGETIHIMIRYAIILDMLENRRQATADKKAQWMLTLAINDTVLAAAEAVGAFEAKDDIIQKR